MIHNIKHELAASDVASAKVRAFEEKYGCEIEATIDFSKAKALRLVGTDYDIELHKDDSVNWERLGVMSDSVKAHVDEVTHDVIVYDVTFSATRGESDERPTPVELSATIEVTDGTNIRAMFDSDEFIRQLEHEFIDEYIDYAVADALAKGESTEKLHINTGEETNLVNYDAFHLFLDTPWFMSRLDDVLGEFAKRLQ